MPINDLTGTTWAWNFENRICAFMGATLEGVTKNISITSNGETFSTATFYRYHGGDINMVSFSDKGVWFSDEDAGTYEMTEAYKIFTITGGTDATDSTVIGWITENATEQVSPQVSVDLSALSGWSSIPAGSHTLRVKAKANGYRDSALSTGVSFTKGGDNNVFLYYRTIMPGMNAGFAFFDPETNEKIIDAHYQGDDPEVDYKEGKYNLTNGLKIGLYHSVGDNSFALYSNYAGSGDKYDPSNYENSPTFIRDWSTPPSGSPYNWISSSVIKPGKEPLLFVVDFED